MKIYCLQRENLYFCSYKTGGSGRNQWTDNFNKATLYRSKGYAKAQQTKLNKNIEGVKILTFNLALEE